MLGNVANLKKHGLACPTLVLVFCVGCSSGLDNRQGSAVGTKPATKRAQSKAKFRNPEMDAMYKAAKAAPRSFEPVYAYAKAVADASLVSLADTSCPACGEGAMKLKPRSSLEPHYWPIIEEALSMLDTLGKVLGLTPDEVDQMTATKGRLLWLAGRSVEEQPLIDDYAKAHPDAVAVIRRRLELLRESGAATSSETQCALSRAKMDTAPEATHVDLLTACVALHPRNTYGRSDLLDYAKYLPNLTTPEEVLYRRNLVERCEAKAGEEGERCEEDCGCDDKEAAKQQTAKCKKACARCHSEMAQRMRLCKKITEAPSAVVRAPRPAPAPAESAPFPKSAPPSDAPRPKRDTGRGPKPLEI
jgi:hypothetical protein